MTLKTCGIVFVAVAFGHGAWPSLAQAQLPPSGNSWGLSRLVERATEASFEIKALEQDVLSAESRAHQAGRWDNPEIGVAAGPKRYDSGSGSILEASIRQNLPLFGKKSIDSQIGQQNRELAEADRALRTLLIRHEVIRLAYDYAAVTEQAKHIGHRREGLLLVAKYLNNRSFASPSQLVEKNLVQNRLREIESLFLEVTSRKDKAWQALNVFLNLPSEISPDISWLESPQDLQKSEFEAQMLRSNPELARQQRVVGLSELTIEQAGKKVYPDIRLGASYTDEKTEIREKTYAVSLEFTLPVFDRGGYARDAASAQREAEVYRLEQKRREASGRFAQAWADYQEARRRVALFPPSLVSSLEDQFKKAEANWKRSLVPITPFLELEGQVHEQIVKVFSAQTDYVRAMSELYFLSGKDFEPQASKRNP